MKNFLTSICMLLALSTVFAQDAARNWSIQLTAEVQESPAEITLNWLPNEQTTPDTYLIWRKEKGATDWGSTITTLPSTTTTYTDNSVEVGVSYEYQIQFRQSSTIYAWGYINSGVQVELPANRGDLLLIVDNTHAVSLSAEIEQLEQDLYRDGWMVTTMEVDPTMSPEDLKDEIIDQDNDLDNLTALYLLGHVPVPYSGDLYPDAHTNHEGAWPADVYYGDLNGIWTDATVNNTVASGTRNDNVPGDGKFDQSQLPSGLELQVARVDFYDLPVYSESEEELLRNYLIKAHEFKMAEYTPLEKGLVDQGGFAGVAEGFAQSGFRNFTAFFGSENVDHEDYWTNLESDAYLWSYGCGSGTFTSAGDLDDGTSLTSTEIAAGDSKGVFTMLFGSYFGDWDITNNLMRVAIANGRTLSCSWAGRPSWTYHTMAMGDHLGNAAKLSQDKNSGYLWLNVGGGGFVTGEGVHVAQLGDPSLRMYYLTPPTAVNVTTSDVSVISWTASSDATVEGYNIYRRTPTSLWTKVNSSVVSGTTFTDETPDEAETYEYVIKSVKTKINSSGDFYNESLASESAYGTFYASLNEQSMPKMNIYPNPSDGLFTIDATEAIKAIAIMDVQGRVVMELYPNEKTVQLDLSKVVQGVYYAQLQLNGYKTVKRLVVQ